MLRAAALAGAAFALGWWAGARKRHTHTHTPAEVLALRAAFARSAGGDEAALADPADVLALIKARRSIFPKDYVADAAPTRAQLEQMLEASNWAPTHGKTEPWRFVVLEQGSIQRFFGICSDAMKEKFGASSDKFLAYQQKQEKSKKDKAKCACIIAICMKRKALPEKLMPEWEEIAATACAVQNMHLMATALQIASYWSSGGPLDHPLVLDFLRLKEEGDRCLGLFYVGMAAKEKTMSYRKGARRGPIEDKVLWLKD
jgi:nitroreductase